MSQFNLSAIPAPLLVLLILGVAVVTIGMLRNLRWAALVVGCMFFVAATAVAKTNWGAPIKLWIYPIQSNRSFLFAVGGAILLIAMLAHPARVTMRSVAPQGLILLAIALYGAALTVVHEGPGAGAAGVIFACVTIAPLAFVIPALIDRWGDYRWLVRVLLIVNISWLIVVLLQYPIDASLLTQGKQNRFTGLTANAQHAAVFCGVMGAVALWSFINETERRRRMLWMALVIINATLLAWSGSRTGAAMFVMGVTVAAYARVGRSLLLLPLVVLGMYVVYTVAVSLGLELGTAERLTSTENTRSGAWSNLLEAGKSSPLIGVGIVGAGDSENSYLFAFAAYGIGMVALVGVLVAVSASMCLRLWRLRPHVDTDKRAMIDLILGYHAMYFLGAVVEGYLLARVAGSLVLILVFSSLGHRMLQAAADGSLFEDDVEDWEEEGEWGEDGEWYPYEPEWDDSAAPA